MFDNTLKLVAAIVGLSGFLLGVYSAIIKKGYKRPKIKLTLGATEMSLRTNFFSKLNKSNIFIIFNKAKTSHPISCIPISIRNNSSLPCTDIIIRVEFPIGFGIENSVFVEDGWAILVNRKASESALPEFLEYIELGDIIQVTYKIEKLRVGEGAAIPHPMRAELFKAKKDIEIEIPFEYNERYRKLDNFISAMKLYVGVFSPDFKKIEKRINIINLDCPNEEQAFNAIEKMAKMSWEDNYPMPGKYLLLPWYLRRKPYNFKKLFNPEYCEVLFSNLEVNDLQEKNHNKAVMKLKSFKAKVVTILLPPWRFFGQTLDLSILGFKVDRTRTDL